MLRLFYFERGFGHLTSVMQFLICASTNRKRTRENNWNWEWFEGKNNDLLSEKLPQLKLYLLLKEIVKKSIIIVPVPTGPECAERDWLIAEYGRSYDTESESLIVCFVAI